MQTFFYQLTILEHYKLKMVAGILSYSPFCWGWGCIHHFVRSI